MKEFAPYIVPLIFAAIIIRRSMQARKVNTSRMWIRPILLLLLLAGALAGAPMPGVIAIAGFLGAAVAGVAVGAYMASHQHLSIDEKTGHVSSRTSVIGTFLVLGLFAIRFGAKIVFPDLAHPGHSAMTQGANGLLIFTVAVLITQTVSVWRRTQPMLAAHAARKLSGEGQSMPAPVPQPVAQPAAEAIPSPPNR